MILLDKLTELDPRFTSLVEKAHPLKVHPDVVALASHLSQDPEKLRKAAAHIFWPDYETWLEWEDERGRIAFYFDGSRDQSVTEGRGLWIAWDHKSPDPVIISLTYDMPGYKLGLLDPHREVEKGMLTMSPRERDIVRQMGANMLPPVLTFDQQIAFRAAADSLRPVIYAILALINSPKLVRKHHVSQERINRSRLKRGKYPYHPHNEVRLDVDKTTVRAMVGSKGDGSHKALHFVRSHLRFRLGQYELVRPHWRGDPEVGIIETEYAAGRAKSKWR